MLYISSSWIVNINPSIQEKNVVFWNHASVLRFSLLGATFLAGTTFLEVYRSPFWIFLTYSPKWFLFILRFRHKFIVLMFCSSLVDLLSKFFINSTDQIILFDSWLTWLHVAEIGFHKDNFLGLESVTLFHRAFDNSTVYLYHYWYENYAVTNSWFYI